MGTPKKNKDMTTHIEFSERSHLLRWFHERSDRELKAMKEGLLASINTKEGGKGCK